MQLYETNPICKIEGEFSELIGNDLQEILTENMESAKEIYSMLSFV